MERKTWTDIKYMNKEELKEMFSNVAKEIEDLSTKLNIKNEEEQDIFDDKMAYYIDIMHQLRTRINLIYYRGE